MEEKRRQENLCTEEKIFAALNKDKQFRAIFNNHVKRSKNDKLMKRDLDMKICPNGIKIINSKPTL